MTTILHTQNLSNKQMKKTYLMPTIELEELIVENGIAQSFTPQNWGDNGFSGADGTINDYGTL